MIAPKGDSKYYGEWNRFSFMLAPETKFGAEMTNNTFRTALTISEGAWAFTDASPNSDVAETFVRLQGNEVPEDVTIDYFGTPVRVLHQQEIFDPVRRLLVRFVATSWSFPVK